MPVPAAAPSCGASPGARDPGQEPGPCLSPSGRLAAAVCLGAVGSLGFCSNLLVLLLFWRYRALRSPINLLLLNIAVSDLLVCALGTPLGLAAAAARGRGSPGAACAWHGFANALCGIVSLISLAVLSYKRYCTMTGKTEADATNYRKTWTGIVLSWTYSLVWTAPPLFGWSSYGPEGPGTTCSVNWHSKDANNASYIICLFIFCLVIPFVIVYSYGRLLCTVRRVSAVNKGTGRSREQRILIMVVVMVICFLLCWLPYATVALIATFGKPGLITPAASVIPSILAKNSTVYNPIIYIFLNKQFYRCFLALLRCNKATVNSSNKSRSCCMLWRAQGDTGPAAESLDPPGNPHPPPEEAPTATKICAGGSLLRLTQAAGPTPPAAAVFGEFESKRESFAK
ncbi:pinopsin-like isoform X1 [Grus americana]|uniref:pinopsin-like isoform X1 n=1 Tax=Grus americana TaxID=9117 RepID=UPI00240808D8|nr:pinopsin-like isoform X1 [Grus americana]